MTSCLPRAEAGMATASAGSGLFVRTLVANNDAAFGSTVGGTYTKSNCSFVEGDGALVAGPQGFVISVR